jgi:gliding motility-associated-like protein
MRLILTKAAMVMLFTLIAFTTNAQLMINEYSCSNISTVTDNFSDTPDWLELYNAGGSAVNLAGYRLSDNKNNSGKWVFPAGITINPASVLRIWASGKNTVVGTNIHTNFKLTQTKPEELVFSDPSGAIIDSMTLNPTQANHSRGRITNGAAQWGVFTTPTAGAANAGAKLEYAARPVMSVAAGFYSATQTITISTTQPSSTIYYTTNGFFPTTSSTVYSAPITVSATTVVRAIAVSSNAQVPQSFCETNTYFINVNHSIPVFSVFGTEVGNLLGGNSGITPQAGLEYFDVNKVQRAETEGEANKHGNDSWAYNQRGIDFLSKDEMGYNYGVNTKLFNNKSRKSFSKIILKAAANDNYPFSNGGAHIRDSYVATISQRGNLHLDERTWGPCIVYINGSYWGVYDVRERVNDSDFTDYYYNQPEDSLQYLMTWGGTWSEYGGAQAQSDWNTLRSYILSNNMAVQANFNYVESQFNTKSLADYVIINSWTVCSDWLNWNTAWWHGLAQAGDARRWRYTLWDMDATFGHYINYTGIPTQAPTANPCAPEALPNPGNQGHIPILNALLTNPGFAQYYKARFIDLMNTTLSCDYAVPLLDSMIAVIQPEMQAQITKWGGSYTTWQANVTTMRDYINTRCTAINQGMIDCYGLTGPYPIALDVQPVGAGTAKINSITPSNYIYTGNYFGNLATILKAKANTGYVFDHWQLNHHTVTDSINHDSVNVLFTQADTVVAVFRLIGTPPVPIDPPVNGAVVSVPTAFSPNGDNNNDLLMVLGDIKKLDFEIYNRWGQLVFKTTDQSVGWDGNFNGKPLNAGVFAYRLSGILPNGDAITKRGNITLVK